MHMSNYCRDSGAMRSRGVCSPAKSMLPSPALSQAGAKIRIESAARRAVNRIGEFTPCKIEGPVEMKIESYPGKPGVSAAELSRSEGKQVAPRTVIYRGRNVLEAFQRWL